MRCERGATRLGGSIGQLVRKASVPARMLLGRQVGPTVNKRLTAVIQFQQLDDCCGRDRSLKACQGVRPLYLGNCQPNAFELTT